MIDLVSQQGPRDLLRSINEADKLGVILADDLRTELDAYTGQPGVKVLIGLLDKDTFVLSDEELERLFLPLLARPSPGGRDRRAALPPHACGPSRDLERDQAHTAAGYARLRFSHWQVKYERAYVKRILGETVSRLNQRGP